MSKQIDLSRLKLLPVPEGFKVQIEHYYSKGDLGGLCREKKNGLPDIPPRYATSAILVNKETKEVIHEVTAFCNPKDVPSRRLGRVIAHNRLIKEYHAKSSN